MSPLTTLFNMILNVLAIAIKEKEMKRLQIRKKEVKMSVF